MEPIEIIVVRELNILLDHQQDMGHVAMMFDPEYVKQNSGCACCV